MSEEAGRPAMEPISKIAFLMNRCTFLIIVSFKWSICLSQTIDTQILDSLSNKHDLYYTDKHGNYMGCGFVIECDLMSVVFYEFVLDKEKRMIRAKGRVIFPGATFPKDTVGAAFSAIYLAQPKGNKLHKVKYISKGYLRDKKDTHEKTFPYETGDFEIDFEFQSKDRLYFDSPMYRPKEYNIGLLLKQ
jgi:hypothetical protein